VLQQQQQQHYISLCIKISLSLSLFSFLLSGQYMHLKIDNLMLVGNNQNIISN